MESLPGALVRLDSVTACSTCTPESLHEKQPYNDPVTEIAITADARVDNREELIRTLSLTRYKGKPISDYHLILSAFEKWGVDCATKLISDFACAIWDKPTRTLYCIGNRKGVKPIFYYCGKDFFAFASEIKALFQISAIPKKADHYRIADFISYGSTENNTTFFQNVRQLPPASYIKVDSLSSQQKQYWDIVPSQIAYSSDKAYEEHFRSIFKDAVECSLRSVRPIGSFLSGGIDSSSIVGTLSERFHVQIPKLHTFSGVFDTLTECDERFFISSILSKYNHKSHFIYGDRLSPRHAFEQICNTFDQPIRFSTFFPKMEYAGNCEKP